MFSFKVLIVLLVCLRWSHCKLDKYCSVCEDHTMCKFHDIGKACVNPGGSGVTLLERKEILDIHNWLRRLVASGYETRGSDGTQPKAANLRKLVWDDELSKVAQRWADQCLFQHDTCRNDPRWKVGQNIYWKWKYPKHNVNWTEAILSWYNEVSQFNPNEVESYRFEPATGHYTQMLWHDTYAIGCGRRDYEENKLYVCNYGPAGNWLGEPLYAIGEPCSKCPEGTVCDEYLCAAQYPEYGMVNPAESKLVDINDIPAKLKSTEKDISESSLEILKQSKGNSENEYSPEGEKTKPRKTQNETQDNEVHSGNRQNVLTYVLLEVEEKTIHSIKENDIELDAETEKGIEEIKLQIEKLVKNVIKKLKNKE